MADVLITSDIALTSTHAFSPNIVMVNKDTFYVFFPEVSTGDIVYTKSTDGGATWGSPVTIFTAASGTGRLNGIWYDRWTPGDSGTEIHVVFDNRNAVAGKKFEYVGVDTNDDTLSSVVTVLNYSAFASAGVDAAIGKAINGNLYIRLLTGDLSEFFLRSTNGGAGWTTRATAGIVGPQWTIHPGKWFSDEADIAAVSHEGGTGDLELWEYDNSADSWAKTDIVQALGNTGSFADRNSAVRLGDGHLFVCGLDINTQWTDVKMRTFDVNGSGSITEKTAITIDAEAGFVPAVFVAPNNDIYICWTVGTGGSRADAKFVKSTDGGSTWGSETSIPASSPTNITYLGVPHTMPNGGLYAPDFLDNSPTPDELYINLDNGVGIGGGARSTIAIVWFTRQKTAL